MIEMLMMWLYSSVEDDVRYKIVMPNVRAMRKRSGHVSQ
jgi:hypothetical protein